MMGPMAGMMGPLGSFVGGGITYLLRDEFTTAQAAPLTSPRTAEPGPGTWTLTGPERFSISGGRLLAVGNGVWGQTRAVGSPFTRSAGKAFFWRQRLTGTGSVYRWTGLASSIAPTSESGSVDHSVMIDGNRVLFLRGSGSGGDNLVTLVADIDYEFAMVTRNTGAYLFIRGGVFTSWTLLGVAASASTATLYPTITSSNGNIDHDSTRVLDLATLDSRFATDYGLATSRISGSVSAGQTFTHEADFVMEWTQTSLPTGGGSNAFYRVRKQDNNNYLHAYVTSNGALGFQKTVAGVTTNLAGGNGFVAAGNRCVIILDGSTIRGYSNNTLRWTITVTEFTTATQGEVFSLGNGSLSNLVTYPRTVTLPEV